MTTSRERCAVCDFPLATGDDFDGEDDGALCWSAIGGTAHRGPRIDWRARALEAERRGVMVDAMLAGARTRVEALEGALRAADYRLGEVSNYLGPFDHALMFRALSETIAQVRAALSATSPKPRPDATEALRAAREALATIAIALSPPLVESGVSEARSVAATAYELLHAHVEPTPLETAVQAHTEKETP